MSVHPSQPSASVGFQLDDPLPSMVTVVQVQEVCVWIQAVLTCRKHMEKPLLKATVIISYLIHLQILSQLINELLKCKEMPKCPSHVMKFQGPSRTYFVGPTVKEFHFQLHKTEESSKYIIK